MPRPTLPTAGATNWDTTLDDAINQVSDTADSALALAQAGGSGGSAPGELALDSFSGTDDAKMSAALSAAGAQTYPPLIRLGNRKYTFNNAIGRVYDGFSIAGPVDSWKSSAAAKVSGCEVHLALTPRSGEPAGYWLEATSGTIWNWAVSNIYFSGTGSTQFLRAKGNAAGGGLLDGCTFHSLQMNGLRSVFGNQNEKCVFQLCEIDGYWSIQGQSVSSRIGGSDNRKIFGDGLNIDSGVNVSGMYHLIFDFCSKSNVGSIYTNSDSAGWRGVKILGNNQNGDGLDFWGVTIEGRNASNACLGELVTVQGGWPHFHGGTIDCGMVSPTAGEKGMISVIGSGAHATFDGVCIDLAGGQTPATVPVFYVGSGGEIICKNIRRMQRDTGSPAWGSAKPALYNEAGTTVHNDDTVNLIGA